MQMLELQRTRSRMGLLPNGRIDWKAKVNINCIKLLKTRQFYYRVIARVTRLSVNQVITRAQQKNLQSSTFRKGETEDSRVILSRYMIIRGTKDGTQTTK